MKKLLLLSLSLLTFISSTAQRSFPRGGTAGQTIQIKADGYNLGWTDPSFSSVGSSPLFFVTAATTGTLAPVTYSSGTLTAVSNGRLADVDGITLHFGDSLLVRNQSAQLQNGIYIISDTGTASTTAKMYRNTRYDVTAEVYPSQVNVLSGTTNGGAYYVQSTTNPTVGTDPLTYISIQPPTAWLLSGNIGTDSTTDFIGTIDEKPLVFKTNNSEKVRIMYDGRIGVGTSTPTNDLSFGNDADKTIWVEESDTDSTGRSLTIQAGSVEPGNDFEALGQTSRRWFGMAAAPNGNIYAAVDVGSIYMQTAGAGNFVTLAQTSRQWFGMTAAPNGNVYASEFNGDIYMQTAGTGNFVALSQTTRNWTGMTATANGNVYACEYGGDIYMQTGGTGNFVALGVPNSAWYGMTTAENGNVYACASSGDIYMQTGGTGDFVALSQTTRNWIGMASSNGNVYASVGGGDIYMQTAGTGNFVALGQTTRAWTSMVAAPNGNDIYASVDNGDIYMQSTNIAGGDLVLSSGQGKGVSGSNIYFQTSTPSSGNDINALETKMTITASGEVILARSPTVNDSSNQVVTVGYVSDVTAAATVTLTAGTGVTIDGSAPSFTVNANAASVDNAVIPVYPPNQGTAFVLASRYNFVNTAGTATMAVKLPAATVGAEITLGSNVANSVTVYPASGEKFQPIATNGAYLIYNNEVVTFMCQKVGEWTWVSNAPENGHYFVYEAVVSQSGTNAPSPTVVRNNFPGTMAWSYSEVGGYLLTNAGYLNSAKTTCSINGSVPADSFLSMKFNSSPNSFLVRTVNVSASYVNGVMSGTSIIVKSLRY